MKGWESEITRAVEQSVFFIPIVTPRAVGSDIASSSSNRSSRARPPSAATISSSHSLHRVPALQEAEWRDDPVLSIVAKRQYVDWRTYR